MTVDIIYFEDLIEFQKIEFNVLRGYNWTGKRDYRIGKVIEELFQKRLKYKTEGNPLQTIDKLILNSCYGKMIQKAIKFEKKYLPDEKLDQFLFKNYEKIIDDEPLDNSNIHMIKTAKSIDDHFTFSLLGIHVLSMSKRIMNEVVCLAADIEVPIYITDTDSIHTIHEGLPRLKKAFKIKYKRDLRGTNLGQFHSDFTPMNETKATVVCATESIFLMKKCYNDQVLMSDGSTEYMFRMKGVTTEAVLAQAKKYGGLMGLYKKLYEGKEERWNLCDGAPAFKMNPNMTILTLPSFER
jgi:hypothetical protein